MSYKFHGSGPGKKKQEKRLRMLLEEFKIKQRTSGDPSKAGMNKALQKQRQSRGQAFVVLSKGSATG